MVGCPGQISTRDKRELVLQTAAAQARLEGEVRRITKPSFSPLSFRFWLYRAWGRTGTSIGGTKLERVSSAEDGKELFRALYEEKTGNDFKNHMNGFRKMPNKLYPIEVEVAPEV